MPDDGIFGKHTYQSMVQQEILVQLSLDDDLMRLRRCHERTSWYCRSVWRLSLSFYPWMRSSLLSKISGCTSLRIWKSERRWYQTIEETSSMRCVSFDRSVDGGYSSKGGEDADGSLRRTEETRKVKKKSEKRRWRCKAIWMKLDLSLHILGIGSLGYDRKVCVPES